MDSLRLPKSSLVLETHYLRVVSSEVDDDVFDYDCVQASFASLVVPYVAGFDLGLHRGNAIHAPRRHPGQCQ